MPQAYLTIGLPGSGKSTFSKRQSVHARIINRDALRLMIYGGIYKFNTDYEPVIKDMALACAYSALNDGHNIIIDETALTKAGRAFWVENLKRAGFNTIFLWFPEQERNLQFRSEDLRGFTVGYWSEVIERLRLQYEKPAEDMSEGDVGLITINNPFADLPEELW